MPYREHELGYLVRFQPKRAKARILLAYRQFQGHALKAAESLGVTKITLVRWTTRLDLRQTVDRIRIRAGKRPSTTYATSHAPRKKQRPRRKSALHQP